MNALESREHVLEWTEEQERAIEQREGDLLLDAGAGSGKTSVLVERFVRAVLEDRVEVAAILAITFTDKAAAELRDRIRTRLRTLGADDAARATEGAFISTIHGFCARVLRAHALAAGLDPRFTVLDQQQAVRLADAAFDEALAGLAERDAAAIELIASYNTGALRGAVLGTYGELRSRGQTEPVLPPLPPAPDLEAARAEVLRTAAEVTAELALVPEPSTRVVQAIERLERCSEVLARSEPGLAELDALKLPGGNGAALSTPACVSYCASLAALREGCELVAAGRAHALLNQLLRDFADSYKRRKRERSALDFEDLELLTRDLFAGHEELRERYRERFEQVMVDEFQDTNQVQLELIEHVSRGNLFTVGDAQQSIYAFRHADVELFERLGSERAAQGRRVPLRTNFRSRREILDVINDAFGPLFGDSFLRLEAGRKDSPAEEPLVELLVADKAGDYEVEGLGAPWRVVEARALARRVEQLLDRGAHAREIVVLCRATTDLRVYERALEERIIPTYVIGGRGYWSHPQVIDVVSYLRALANPRDEEWLYTVLASPLVGVSLDTLVVLAGAARAAGRDPWWVLRDPAGSLDDVGAADRARLSNFVAWFASERAASPRLGIEELIERLLSITGYDLAILAMPGGRRRLANVRKLMRLGREFELEFGPDLRGFLDLVHGRTQGWAGYGDARESEAPVEGEALDAVRLMTIHRAKGLEFDVVCVADLGRGPRFGGEMIRVGREGRFGIKVGQPGTGKTLPALAYNELGEEERAAAEREERRLFYVAMTRARERLILSGAARVECWEKERSPIGWIGPAVMEAGVEAVYVAGDELTAAAVPAVAVPDVVAPLVPEPDELALSASERAPVRALSYSGLGEYARCGYRFYAERVLGLPPVDDAYERGGRSDGAERLSALERGILVHALLEKLDFQRPVAPTATEVIRAAPRPPGSGEADQISALIALFGGSAMCERLGRAGEVRREERFAFLLGSEVLVNGALDVLAREGADRMLIVDYKSDRLEGGDPRELVHNHYRTQRLVYALAALRAGAREVEVAHLFLEAPRDPVTATFAAADAPGLEEELTALAAGVLRGEFTVTELPHRGICSGCPAEGGLCSWPLSATRRETPDRLF